MPESQDAMVRTLADREPESHLLTSDDLTANAASLEPAKQMTAPPCGARKPGQNDNAATVPEASAEQKGFEPDSLDENDNMTSELNSVSVTPNTSFSIISPSTAPISETSPHDLAAVKGFKPINADSANQEPTLSDDSVSIDKTDSLLVMHSSEYIRKMKLQRELSPDSLMLDVSVDSLNKSTSTERSEIKFELGRDKRLSSSRHESDSTPSPHPADSSASPIHKSDLFINIDNSPKTEISAFSSPSRVYKELTPESSTHVLQVNSDGSPADVRKRDKDPNKFERSELRLSVGDHKVPKTNPDFEITFNAPTDTNITLDDSDLVFGEDDLDGRNPVSEGEVIPNSSSREQSQPRTSPTKSETVSLDIELSQPIADRSLTFDSEMTDTTQYMDLPTVPLTTTELSFDPLLSEKSEAQVVAEPVGQDPSNPNSERIEPSTQPQLHSESPQVEPDTASPLQTGSGTLPVSSRDNAPSAGAEPPLSNTEPSLAGATAPADLTVADLEEPSQSGAAADETDSVSTEGQEYSKTETAETEEMIETSVSTLYI